MRFEFLYDLSKDIENYKRASKSINSKMPTKMQSLYIVEYGDVFEDQKLESFITTYIAKQGLNMSAEAERIKAGWQIIEREFLKRVERIFGIACPLDVMRVYLTTDGRCSYNTEQGYFFVSVTRSYQNGTIMHELFHFWTGWVFYEEVESGRMTKEQYNAVKESLTELINAECDDLLGDSYDAGYPQHQEIRSMIRKVWLETKDIKHVFEAATKMVLSA